MNPLAFACHFCTQILWLTELEQILRFTTFWPYNIVKAVVESASSAWRGGIPSELLYIVTTCWKRTDKSKSCFTMNLTSGFQTREAQQHLQMLQLCMLGDDKTGDKTQYRSVLSIYLFACHRNSTCLSSGNDESQYVSFHQIGTWESSWNFESAHVYFWWKGIYT